MKQAQAVWFLLRSPLSWKGKQVEVTVDRAYQKRYELPDVNRPNDALTWGNRHLVAGLGIIRLHRCIQVIIQKKALGQIPR